LGLGLNPTLGKAETEWKLDKLDKLNKLDPDKQKAEINPVDT
jgi:hypothetical protein